MSDIGLSYDVQPNPAPVKAKIGLSFDNTTLKAKIENIDLPKVVLKPTGNVAEEIVSGVAWPLAETLALVLPSLAQDILDRIGPIDVMTVDPFEKNIGGIDLTITPQNLNMSGWNGMLKIEGSIQVS